MISCNTSSVCLLTLFQTWLFLLQFLSHSRPLWWKKEIWTLRAEVMPYTWEIDPERVYGSNESLLIVGDGLSSMMPQCPCLATEDIPSPSLSGTSILRTWRWSCSWIPMPARQCQPLAIHNLGSWTLASPHSWHSLSHWGLDMWKVSAWGVQLCEVSRMPKERK